MATHRDPNGWTAAQAVKEAEKLFTKHPKLGVVYKGSKMLATHGRCGGQTLYAGAKATRGCGHSWHLQPCPGGPEVYTISRLYNSGMGLAFNAIEGRGDSWKDALDRIEKHREDERKRYAKPEKPTKKRK